MNKTTLTKTLGVSMLAMLLLSACNSAQGQSSGDASANNNAAAATEANASANTSANESSDAAAGQQGGPGAGQMDEGQMKMAMTFRSLIRMDEQEGLEITKDQAESMLSIVQEAVTANELTDEQDASLTALLTEDQQTYLTEASSQMGGRTPGEMPEGGMPEGGQPGQGAPGADTAAGSKAGTPPEDGGQPPELPQGDSQTAEGNSQDAAAGTDSAGQGPGQRGGGPGSMMNAGEQLIELLQSKTSAAE